MFSIFKSSSSISLGDNYLCRNNITSTPQATQDFVTSILSCRHLKFSINIDFWNISPSFQFPISVFESLDKSVFTRPYVIIDNDPSHSKKVLQYAKILHKTSCNKIWKKKCFEIPYFLNLKGYLFSYARLKPFVNPEYPFSGSIKGGGAWGHLAKISHFRQFFGFFPLRNVFCPLDAPTKNFLVPPLYPFPAPVIHCWVVLGEEEHTFQHCHGGVGVILPQGVIFFAKILSKIVALNWVKSAVEKWLTFGCLPDHSCCSFCLADSNMGVRHVICTVGIIWFSIG